MGHTVHTLSTVCSWYGVVEYVLTEFQKYPSVHLQSYILSAPFFSVTDIYGQLYIYTPSQKKSAGHTTQSVLWTS